MNQTIVDPDTLLAPPLVLRLEPVVRLTEEQFFELCQLNGELRIERTCEGDLLIMPPAGGESSNQNFKLTGCFSRWVDEDGRGIGFDSSGGFILPNRAMRSPDLAWVERSRWEGLKREERKKFVPLCPDFAVELRSPSDRLRDVQAKMEEYIENGLKLGWLIDPLEKRVYIYRPGMPVERLDDPRTVSGDPFLPGFVLEVAKLWS